MAGIVEKFVKLKTSIGGNREKTGYEDTFGMPKEEQAHITRPNKANNRIVSELEFALHVSREDGGRYDGVLEQALDFLLGKMGAQGVLTNQDCEAAEGILSPMAEEAKSYKLILAAHAHIDMNWMWSFNETVAVTLATFRSILNIMDQYPQFKYSQSQGAVYKIVEEYDPELMEEIKARIAQGRWEVTASAWVETDKNMPTGESLLRHIQYTKEYMEKVWGARDLEVDFSPDTFGHSANVPEIDRFGEVKYYYHCRGNGGEEILYRYKAPSGKEVLAYREPNWYNGAVTPHMAAGLPELARRCCGLRTGLAVYGVGDHGGGPTRRDVERALEMMEWPIYPEIVFGTFREFFKEAESVWEKLPVVERELNYSPPAAIPPRAGSRGGTAGWRHPCWTRRPCPPWRESSRASDSPKRRWRTPGGTCCSPISMTSSPAPACRIPGNMPWDCSRPPWPRPTPRFRMPCIILDEILILPPSRRMWIPITASRKVRGPATG